jgi:hypothetical protein
LYVISSSNNNHNNNHDEFSASTGSSDGDLSTVSHRKKGIFFTTESRG